MSNLKNLNPNITVKFYRHGLIIAFILCQLSVHSQLITLPTIETIEEKNGLPFNVASSILQDKEGFIWIAGPLGLCRYDGYKFWTLPSIKTDSSTLWSNEIYSLTLHSNGNLWAAHASGKISIVNTITGKVKRIHMAEAKGSAIRTILIDSRGIAWLAVNGLGVWKYAKDKFQFVGDLDNLPKGADPSVIPVFKEVNRFYESRLGAIWVATNNGLYTVSPDSKSLNHVTFASDNPKQGAFIHNILSQGDSIFWMPTYGDGLIEYKVKSGKYKTHTFESGWKGTYNIIYNAAWKNDHELWMISWGLGSFNTKTKKFTFYYDRNELFGQRLTSNLMVDFNGTVWATSNEGLLKYNETYQPFQFHKLKVERSDNRSYYGVTKVLYDSAKERTILATTMTDGLFIFDKNGKTQTVKVPLHPKDEPYQILYNVNKTRAGQILISSRGYLSELTSQNQLKPIAELNNQVPVNDVPYFIRFIETSNRDWYVGSYLYGIFKKKKGDTKWTRFDAEKKEGPADNSILTMQESTDGKIWIGYASAGVGYYDPSKNVWKNFSHDEKDSTSLISNRLTNIAMQPGGKVWVSTLDGIAVYNPSKEKFEYLRLADGTDLKPAYSVAADDFGNMWVLTSKNIVMVKPDLTYRLFGYEDGINPPITSYKIANIGYDWMQLGTFGGYYTFRPSQIMNQPILKSPLVITDVRNGNMAIENFRFNKNTQLDFESNHVSLSFAALNYMPKKNKYLYRMEGLDKEWTETTTPEVTYSGIPSGSYTFRVKLAGDERSSIALPIVVSTPFYRTSWFRLSMMLAGLGGVFLVYRLRLQQIRRDEKLKSDFKQQLAEAETKALKAQMSPHFIFNSLNSINRYIVKNEPEKASTYLTKFSKLIRLILDNSNQKIISLDQEINYLKLYVELEALRFNDKFTYAIQVSEDINPMSVGVPPMIIQPFIENAIWHGLLHKETPGHLNVSMERFGSGLQCIITDNGVGRKKASELKSKSVNREKSYGMKITKDRLDMLNGDNKISNVEIIDLQDPLGNPVGTKVIVKIMSAEMEPEF